MGKWLGRFRALVPASLAARGALLIGLVVAAIGGPAYAGHRLLVHRAQWRQQHDSETIAAAVLAEYAQRAPASVAERQEWVKTIVEQSDRVRWAGLFDRSGEGFEFRRRTALPRETILTAINFDATAARRERLVVDGGTTQPLDLWTFPQPEPGVVLALVLDQADESPAAVAWPLVGLAALALAGLAAAAAWFHLGIARPIGRVGRTLASVQEGLSRVSADAMPPSELRQLVESVAATQRELKHWRVEAAYLRHSVEVQVDARTRKAERAVRRAEQAADTDALTQLGNRRALEREMPRLFEAHRQTGTELSIIMVDLDGFKRLNDTLGHTTGDALLGFVGGLMRSVTRQGLDVAVRYGGDEFVLLLPGTTLAQACDVARRLGVLFAQRARTIEGLDPPPSLSSGVAALRENRASTWEDLLHLADEAMYAAKRNHRGVATAGEASAAPGYRR